MYLKIERCRVCGNRNLVEVLDLGVQALTGVFPKSPSDAVTSGPLRLVKCRGRDDACGLLQLAHTYDLAELYGDNYGYRSGLNASMVTHLHGKVRDILARIAIEPGALIVDIGSNDATTLRAYPASDSTLVGFDPSGAKFSHFYPPHIRLIADFFSSARLRNEFGGRKASVITSFSMFYDLEAPLQFMQEVSAVLADDGLWVFEQSYMPTMLARNSYDTVCHEHLEYYALRQIKWMTDRADLKIVDVEFNDVNGGSFSVTAARKQSDCLQSRRVAEAFQAEARLGLDTLQPYRDFAQRVAASRRKLQRFVRDARRSHKTVAALGASTKGNVILQYCGFTSSDIASIGEVNEDKFGRFSPGSLIPIVPELELLQSRPDYLLVLPWHFRRFFESEKRFADHKLLFPLPDLDVG